MNNRLKSGGRAKGTPNTITKIQREFVQTLLDNQSEKIEMELSKLEGKEYLSVVLNFMEYCIPKLNRTETVNLEDRRQGLIDFEIIQNITNIKNKYKTLKN